MTIHSNENGTSREDPTGALQAAEIANGEADYERAESAILEALARLRKQRYNSNTDGEVAG